MLGFAPSWVRHGRSLIIAAALSLTFVLAGATFGQLQAHAATRNPAQASACITHIIRTGETADGIAYRYHITLAQLESTNPGLSRNPNLIIAGRGIRICY